LTKDIDIFHRFF